MKRQRAIPRALGRAAAGALAGVVAGFAMNEADALWSAIARRVQRRRQPPTGGEPATVKAAEAIVGPIEDPKRKARAGSIAHYVMSAATGAMYGLTASALPVVALGRGLVYGAAVWLLADELAVPALRLSSWRAPVSAHARALFDHLAFGTVLDAGVRVAHR